MKTKPLALKSAILVSALTLCTTLSAESTTSSTTATERRANTTSTTAAELSRSDRNFFEKAAKSGMKELIISQSVLAQLTHPQVKEFAQMMVTEHKSANAELMSLASRKGVTLPVKEMNVDKKWNKKTDDVDEDYIEEMVSDHKDAVELFEDAAKSKDSDIAAFAQKTLPKLQKHLNMAKELEKIVD